MVNWLFMHHKGLEVQLFTVLSRASAHGCSQLKCQKLRVGGYTEKVLKWFNYPCARAHPECKVSCQGVPHRRFVHALSRPAQQWRKLCRATKLTDSSSLAVHKFRAAGKERCERGHRRVCANVWCLMSWCPKCTRTIAAMWAQRTYLRIHYTII